MNKQCIQYPRKRSLKPSKSISAFRALVENTNGVFTMFWFFTNCTKFVIQGQDENYIPGSQNFLRPKFHLNLLRWRCKNSKPFSNFRPPQLPRQSSANSYKTLERSVTKVRHWELLWIRYNTLVARQRLNVVLISRQKELRVVLEATKFDLESDEVLCNSPPRYLN